MLTLAFDTSSKTASVAILQDSVVVYELMINLGINHSEVLLSSIDEICKRTGVQVSNIDFFACTLGPGSFTGLRIGVSTLKGLMFATGKPAVGVSTLAALALNVKDDEAVICPVTDAGRGQVYTASYRYRENGLLAQISPEIVLAPEEIKLEDNSDVIFLGDGAIKYGKMLMENRKKIKIAGTMQQYIRAAAVGILGYEKYNRNELLSPAGFGPVYLRSADAKPGRCLFEK